MIKVTPPSPLCFTLADNAHVAIHDPVVTTGANGEAGGHLLQAVPQGPDPAHGLPLVFVLTHDAPLSHGDSGGPLTTLDGKLIGIEVLVRGVYFGPRQGVALRPDSHWLNDLLAQDRRIHAPALVSTTTAGAP